MNLSCAAVVAGLFAFWAAVFAALSALFGLWNTIHFTAALLAVFIVACLTRAFGDVLLAKRAARKEWSK